MNERIFELAEQAYEETHRVMGSTCLQEAFDDFYTEKFAELLLQEAADAIAKDSRLNDVRSAANGCVRTIREHFGVE